MRTAADDGVLADDTRADDDGVLHRAADGAIAQTRHAANLAAIVDDAVDDHARVDHAHVVADGAAGRTGFLDRLRHHALDGLHHGFVVAMLDHQGRQLAIEVTQQQQVAVAHLVKHGDGVALAVVGLAQGVDGAHVRDIAAVANGHIIQVVADVLDEAVVANGHIAQRGVVDTAVFHETVGDFHGALAVAEEFGRAANKRWGDASKAAKGDDVAYDQALAYAKERAQFGKKIITFPAVYDMLSRMKAKIDASRAVLYQTARYVDIYKTLEDISRERKLTPEERKEMKKYSRLADAFTPLGKGMTSEYANQNAYDCVSVHGGSGFIMEYKAQRLLRDARIFSIYEGTTQLQVVAAVRYITNGTYLGIMREMLAEEVCDCMKPLRDRVAKLVDLYEEAVEKVKADENQDEHDFLARRMYNMTGDIILSLLLLRDATNVPEEFAKSANVYVRMAEEECVGSHAYIMNFKADDLSSFVAE